LQVTTEKTTSVSSTSCSNEVAAENQRREKIALSTDNHVVEEGGVGQSRCREEGGVSGFSSTEDGNFTRENGGSEAGSEMSVSHRTTTEPRSSRLL